MPDPLSSFPITSTGDADEAQSILSRELADLRIKKARNSRAFRMQMNGVHIGQTLLGFNRFDTDTLIEPDGVLDIITLVIGVGAPATFHLDGKPVVCDGAAAIATPSRRLAIHRPADGGLLIVKASFDAVERRLWQLLDRRPGKSIVFERGIDLTQGVGAQLGLIVKSVVDTLEQDKSTLENRLLRAGFDDMLLNALLALPHNFSDELAVESRRTLAPVLVRRAEEFMEANAGEPITISDILTQFSCSKTALYSAFRSYRDYSPMQFLTECRLRSAQRALQSPTPGDTVSSIAYAHGFSHLGRFTAIYRKRYGELPSEVLRRARYCFDR